MPRLEPHPRYLARTVLDPSRLFAAWIALGVLILLALPISSWHNHSIGWLPYWLVLAPAISLALSRRNTMAAALDAFLARGRRRRKPGARRVAVPTPRLMPFRLAERRSP